MAGVGRFQVQVDLQGACEYFDGFNTREEAALRFNSLVRQYPRGATITLWHGPDHRLYSCKTHCDPRLLAR
jgi:hypothetical protein